MKKTQQIENLCAQKDIGFTVHPPGTFEDYRSKAWEFRRGRQRVAVFTSPDRCIEWLEQQPDASLKPLSEQS